VEDQPTGRIGGVDVLVQRAQTDAACGQDIHGVQKLAWGARQTAQPGNDQQIRLAGKRQGGGKLREIRSGAAQQSMSVSRPQASA
jgi:hypothetical protein